MHIIFWFSIIILAGVYITGPLVDPDLWWHITAGRWMIANVDVPTVDLWTMFGRGRPWLAYSWSNEILFAGVDLLWGVKGLLVLKIVVAISLAFSLCYCLSKVASNWFVGSLLGVYATVACYWHFTLRPQSLVWIVFAWLLYAVSRSRLDGSGSTMGIRLVLLMSLWANSHLSSILGIVAVAGWLCPATAQAWAKERVKMPLYVTAAAFAGTLVTPYFGAEWLTFFSKTSHPFLFASVIEFGPANILQYSTVFLLLILLLFQIQLD